MAWLKPRPNGRWRGMYLDAAGIERNAKGPHGEASSKFKREARSWAEDEEARIRAGAWVDPDAGKITFAQYVEESWFKERRMEVTTRSTYWSHYRSEFKAAFGGQEIKAISPGMVQRWINDMDARGVSAGTIVAKYKHLATILGAQKGVSAVRDGLIKATPCQGIQLPEVDPRPVDFYEVTEAEALIAAMGTWWACIPMLAGETGYRWGELQGLSVGDFDEGYATVNLQRTIVQLTIGETGNGTPFIWKARPKNRRRRRTAISRDASTLVETLVRERQLFPKDRLFSMPDNGRRQHGGGSPGALPKRSVAWPEGVPISRSFFREQIWLPAHVATGVKPRRFHDLRGSHLTWLLAGGADLKTVQERGDHASIKTTELYLGAMRDADRRALDALELTKKRAHGE